MGYFDFADAFGSSLGDLFGDVAPAVEKASGWADTLGKIGGVASAAGKLSSLFTSDDDLRAAATPKFAYRPMEEALTDTDKLRAYLEQRTKPITIPTRRLTAEEMGDATFAPQAVMALQGYADEQAAAQPMAAAPSAPSSVFPQSDAQEANLRRLFETDPNDMSQEAKMKRLQAYKLNTALQNFQDGQVNPNTGEKFDRARFLKFMEDEANFNTMRPRNTLGFQPMTAEEAAPIQNEREALYRQTFIPSKSKQSFLGKYGPSLMLAAMTAGIGAGAGALAGPTISGGISPAMGATGFKGLTSLATGGVR
jgi:hypothetical protein